MIICKEISLSEDLSWDGLAEESSTATFFQTQDWLTLWLKHFPIETKILGVFDGEELIGLAPFSIVNHTVSFLGTTPVLGKELVSDFGDLIAKKGREKEVWEAVLKDIKNQISKIKNTDQKSKIIRLNFIHEDSPSFKILQELGGQAEIVDVAPYIDLPATWEAYLTSLDRHGRHEMKRKIRKCESENIRIVSSEDVISDTNEFFRLMQLSSIQKRDFLTKGMQTFFGDIFHTFSALGRMELFFLQKEGKNIGTVILFTHRDTVLLYNSGFDPEFSSLSPGFVLVALVMKDAIEKGRKRFDFLRGGERYKFDLGGKERKLYKFTF